MTSEQKFGISKQPVETCPKIDKVVEAVLNIEKLLENYTRNSKAEMQDMCKNIEWEIYDIKPALEDIRANCEDLRSWGNEWKSLVKEMG